MANTSLSDHVMVFTGTLSPEYCRTLIDRFESSGEPETCRIDNGYSFTQLNVTEKWPDENKTLVPLFLSYFNKYQVALDARFWPLTFCLENLRVKRYLPNGRDFFPLHVDVMGQVAAKRFMTAFIYLNATEGGGETVFPNLDLSITPEPGKLLAFPPIWLFPHEGRPPTSGPKYILHTYLCYPIQDPTCSNN